LIAGARAKFLGQFYNSYRRVSVVAIARNRVIREIVFVSFPAKTQ